GTSARGANHRRPKPSSCRVTKAVSARFISAATACIQSAGASDSIRHTAAGLPPKGWFVNASTCQIFTRRMLVTPQFIQVATETPSHLTGTLGRNDLWGHEPRENGSR